MNATVKHMNKVLQFFLFLLQNILFYSVWPNFQYFPYGIIHLVRTQFFSKSYHFLHPDTQTYVDFQ